MNILIVANTHFPVNLGNYLGGIESICGETFRLINQKGDHKAFLAVSRDSRIDEYSDRVYRHEKDSVWELKKNPAVKRVMYSINESSLRKYCEDNKIDVIFSNAPRVPFVSVLARMNIPIVHLIHQSIFAHFDFFTYKGIAAALDQCSKKTKVLAVSNYVKNSVNNALPGFINGVLNPSLVNMSDASRGDEKHMFFTAGRIQPNYFIKELTEAVVRAGFSMGVAGSPNDYEGSYFQSFQDLINKYPDKITYYGQLPHSELMLRMGESKYYITPIDAEAYGMAALEACHMGCRIIGIGNPELSGVTDFAKSNMHLMTPKKKIPNSVDEITNFIQNLENTITEDVDHYEVREYFRKEHSSENYYTKLIKELESVL